MKVYNYDGITFEYINESEADLNPVATRREGKEVYLLPANATFKKPPSVKEHKIVIFDVTKDKWLVKDDYRGEYICNEAMDVKIVSELGSLPEGYILITQGQAEQIAQDDLWYIIQDGELIKNPNYEEQKAEREAERVGNLQCTKRVFVLMLEQLGLDYFEQIEPAINANRNARLEWELCVQLQRKNPLLDQLATSFGVTPKQLDDLFKYANGEITMEEFINE